LLRNSPCKYIPVRSTAASMRPTVLKVYVGQPVHASVMDGELQRRQNVEQQGQQHNNGEAEVNGQ